MPVDLYVDPVTGDDAATGGMADPFRTLSRAAIRAAELDLAGESGSIRAAAGIYGFPAENFPIIIPASFDLFGAGLALTEVVFTGETREYYAEDGTRITYWGGEAIQGGRSIRGLTLRATPAPYYTCFGMTGIRATVEGTVVEDVRVHINPADAPIPDGASYSEVGFGRELWASGIEITVLDSYFERASRDGMLLGLCDGAILGTTSDNAEFSASSDGSLMISGCTFRGKMQLKIWGKVNMQSSRVLDYGVNVAVSGDGGRFGPGNVVHGYNIDVGDNAEVSGNQIYVGWTMTIRENGRVVENDIQASQWTRRLLEVRRSSGTPVIQGNRFVALPAVDPAIGRNGRNGRVTGHDFTPIEIFASADFGGGISLGQNDFSQLFTDIFFERLSQIRVDASGGVVRFDDNFWEDPSNVERLRFEIVSPDTMLSVRNPMRAP